jgi:sulfate adenylyltransferase (ADP) / ATP adenylyltransferase
MKGPSQPHKHIQISPLKKDDFSYCPLLPIINKHSQENQNKIKEFQFEHLLVNWNFENGETTKIFEIYTEMLNKLDLIKDVKDYDKEQDLIYKIICFDKDGKEEIYEYFDTKKFKSYNLIMNKNWLLIVPRKNESYNELGSNALGFTGSMFFMEDYLVDNLDIDYFDYLKKLTF